MKSNKKKTIIQILAVSLIFWIAEFIHSSMATLDATFIGFPLKYYVGGVDFVSGKSEGELSVANLAVDILFWLAISTILILLINKLRIRNKNI